MIPRILVGYVTARDACGVQCSIKLRALQFWVQSAQECHQCLDKHRHECDTESSVKHSPDSQCPGAWPIIRCVKCAKQLVVAVSNMFVETYKHARKYSH